MGIPEQYMPGNIQGIRKPGCSNFPGRHIVILHPQSGWPQVAPQRGVFNFGKAPLGLSI